MPALWRQAGQWPWAGAGLTLPSSQSPEGPALSQEEGWQLFSFLLQLAWFVPQLCWHGLHTRPTGQSPSNTLLLSEQLPLRDLKYNK